MIKNRNQQPYFDDFNSLKNYFQMLFVPGRAVQGRELTQLQTILQNQINRSSSHFFKNGTSISNGDISVTFDQDWVQVDTTDSSGNNVSVDDTWIDRTFIGEDSDSIFKVNSVDSENNILYILQYSGTIENESINIDGNQDNLSPTQIPATIINSGKAVRANSDAGIIFANGFFIEVLSQELIIQSDSNDGYFDIGYEYVDKFTTEGDDVSLFDPASGSTNANAPGAHRYNAELKLASYSKDEERPENFFTFIVIDNGSVIQTNNKVQYSDIMELFADRTYDESGDYTVKEFPIILEDNKDDSSKLDILLEPGNAFVKGYNYETISTTLLTVDKPRTTELSNNVNIYSSYGSFFIVDSITGAFDVSRKEVVQLFSEPNGTGKEIGANNEIRLVGIHNISPGIRAYLSGISNLQNILDSVRSIVSGNKVINVATRVIEEDTLIGEVTQSLYGISPNPAPIFTLGKNNVSDVVLNETIYNSQKSFMNYTNKSGSDFIITADDSQTDFDVSAPIISIVDSSTLDDLTSSASAAVSNVNGGTSTISISGLGSSSAIDIIVKTLETQSNPKTKTLTTGNITFTADSSTKQILPHFDILDLIDVQIDGVVSEVNSIKLNDGQKDYFYDFGELFDLEDGRSYDVEYRYFSHSGSGDYFSVNSYTNSTNEAIEPEVYSLIRLYKSEDGLIEYSLRDCLDFRRSINDVNSGTDIPSPESSIIADFNFYLPRIDKIYLTSEGTFGVNTGVPSNFPDEPNETPNSMTLYTLNLPGYVDNSEDVIVRVEDTRGYTMRDINRLEKRIEDLEYYTSLNTLESDTNSMTILDENGINRFKNGILVDGFQDHSIGNVSDVDYLCSIDEDDQVLRPPFSVNSIDLAPQQHIYNGETAQIPGISVNKNTYSFEFEEVAMIDQPRASESINVNPYNVFVWYGNISLTPPSDNWIDTEWRPSVTVTMDGNVDAMRKQAAFMGTKWGSWKKNWTGETSNTVSKSESSTEVDRSNWRRGPHGTWLTKVTTTATTKTTTTTRKGIAKQTGRKLNVTSRKVQKDLGSKIVDTRVVPFIRSKDVTFEAEGFKPNTQIKAFFDNVDVTEHCTGVSPVTPIGQLITSAAGQLKGTFSIPQGAFRTGQRDLVLVDDIDNPGTEGKATYTAQGTIQTKQRQILSVEVPEISVETVTRNRPISSTSVSSSTTVTQERSRPYDPIAQSFFVDEEGGVFISSIEVFFRTKDNNIPLSCEIVSNDNGYPSINTLPFAKRVLYPDDVNISEDGSVGTTFTFSDPVYLEHLGDYSFVLKSNSNNYEAFVAKVGDVDVLDGKVISEQPYIGSFFKSQNAFTWTADQERDMKFVINRCEFDVNQVDLFIDQFNDLDDNRITSFYPNIDILNLEGTTSELFFKLANSSGLDLSLSGYERLENKEDFELNAQTSIGLNSPIRFLMRLNTAKSTISPIIHRYRNSAIVVNNFSRLDGNDDLYAGTYVSSTVTLADAADDLKLLIDVEKELGSDIEVEYKIGEVIPRFVSIPNNQVENSKLEGKRAYVYHIGTDEIANIKGSLIVTNIDDSNDRFFIKQVSNVASFIDQAEWQGLNLDPTRGVIATNDTELDGLKIVTWNNSDRYDRVSDNSDNDSYVAFNGNIYKTNVSNNINQEPGTGYAWELISYHTLTSEIIDDVSQSWQKMVQESDIDSSVDTTTRIEYSYKPENDIREDFTQFAVKINFRVSDPARIPKCRELRVLALS